MCEYSFYTSDGSGINEQFIFDKTLDKTRYMTIPFNTWSPDNKYLFILHNIGDLHEALVFRADGQPMTDIEKNWNQKG